MAGTYVIAIWDFEAGTEQELSFPAGARLKILEDDNPDWYEADYQGQVGMVPRNYFEPDDVDDVDDDWDDGGQDDAGSQTSGYSSGAASVAARKDPILARVLYDYEAQNGEELTVTEGDKVIIMDDSDPEWYKAKHIAKLGQGFVPKTYVEIEEAPAGGSKKSSASKGPDPKRETENRAKEEERKRKEAEKARKKEEDARKKEEDMAAKAERDKQKEEDRREAERRKAEEQRERDRRREEETREREARRAEEQRERDRRKEEERKRREEEQRIENERIAKEKAAMQAKLGARSNKEVFGARVTAFEKRGGNLTGTYYFSIDLSMNVGNRVIYRTYQEFYDFHVQLLEVFPAEAGEGGSPRTIPYLPGHKIYVNDAITRQRRVELDTYMQQLIKLPEKISQSRAVIEFLEARPTDDPSYATAPDYSAPTSGAVANQPMNPAPRSAASLPSGGSGGGSGGGASRGALPPGPAAANTRSPPIATSDRAAIPAPEPPGGGRAGRPAPPRPAPSPSMSESPPTSGRSAPGPASSSSRPAPSSGSTPSLPQRPNSAAGRPPPAGGPRPGGSSVSLSSSSSSSSSSSGPRIKVKAYYKSDIVCTLVPTTVRYSELRDRLFKKLGTQPKPLQFKDEDDDLVTIQNDDDLSLAIEASPGRLLLWVAL